MSEIRRLIIELENLSARAKEADRLARIPEIKAELDAAINAGLRHLLDDGIRKARELAEELRRKGA
jgi:hypothetical protein